MRRARPAAVTLAILVVLVAPIVHQPPASAAPATLRVGQTATVRGDAIDVDADGCAGRAAVFLYSGTAPARSIVGYAEDPPETSTLLYVPWWAPAGVDLSIDAACLSADGNTVEFTYPTVAVDLQPDVSDPDVVGGTLDPEQVTIGQQITYRGGPCTIGTADPTGLTSLLYVFPSADPAAPGIPALVGGGPATDQSVEAQGIAFGADVAPGRHLVLPVCTNLEAWQALPSSILTVTPNVAAVTMRATATANRRVVITGAGCASGPVQVFVQAFATTSAAVRAAHARRLVGAQPTAVVAPGADGTWRYPWGGPAPRSGSVLVTATCGDLASSGWAYEEATVVLTPPRPTTSTTAAPTSTTSTSPSTSAALPAPPAALPLPADPAYTG